MNVSRSSICRAGTALMLTLTLLVPSRVSAADEPAYPTRNGPRTESALQAELTAAGYPGPWDLASVLNAYDSATTATSAPTAQPAADATGSSGNVVAFQTISGPYGVISVEAQMNPRKKYVARVRSDPPEMQVSLSTPNLKDLAVTTPWESELQFEDREGYARYDNTRLSWLIASKAGFPRPNGSLTAEIVEAGDVEVIVPRLAPSTGGSRGGCGSRGGPGYRLPNGKCASWSD
jgi:hypothetical protein